MSLGTPTIEIIAQNVLAQLQQITTTNGYPYTLNVARVSKRNPEGHLKCYIYQDDVVEDEKKEDEQTFNLVYWHQPFMCECFVMPADGDTTSIDTYINAITSSIRYAVMQGTNFRQTVGGIAYAVDTKTNPHTILRSSDGQQAIVIVPVDVWYRYNYANPFALA